MTLSSAAASQTTQCSSALYVLLVHTTVRRGCRPAAATPSLLSPHSCINPITMLYSPLPATLNLRAAVIEIDWVAGSGATVRRRTNVCRLGDDTMDVYTRVVTFDGAEHNSLLGACVCPVPLHVTLPLHHSTTAPPCPQPFSCTHTYTHAHTHTMHRSKLPLPLH
jgi:hypothetical protein